MREMKDSGIEWIGEIPKEWKINKIKYMFSNGKGLPITKENLIDEGLPVISYGQIHSKNNNGTDIEKNLLRFVNENYSIRYPQCSISENDFVFADTSEDYDGCGNCVFKRDNSKVFAGYHTIILHSLLERDNRFLAYLFKTDTWRKQIREKVSGVKVFSITQKTLMNCNIILPGYKEEKIIADFLDTQCSEIDATAEDIQKEISLLEDYKKSLVYNVISNGINHSIYSTENDEVWGNLPQGWKLVDIKYLFEIVKRIAGKEGYDVLSVTQKGLKIKDITSGDGQLADNYCGYQFVYPTDYVMNHMDLLTGWVDCSELFGVTSPDYRVFRLIDRSAHNLVYYKYVMQCCYMNKIFYSLGQGVSNLGRWRLQTSSFNNFKVPVPPKDEQDEIADYLDTKRSEIDSLIADKKRQLDILANYKKSLIYEYVTGKKEVPVKDF